MNRSYSSTYRAECSTLGFAQSLLLLLVAPMLSAGASAQTTNLMLKPTVPLPGGLGVGPVITSLVQTQGVLSVQWFGIEGPYQLMHSSSPQSSHWWTLGSPTTQTQITVPFTGNLDFFRVTAGDGHAQYIGAQSCWLCHLEAPVDWSQTPHGQAFNALKAVGQQNNSSCLPCHTVGFGTPFGFHDEATTPQLAGVQCESCHGPAASHVAQILDPSVRPKVTVAAEVCGGCHDFHHPTYNEWKQSLHGQSNAVVSTEILQDGLSTMLSCGPCHSAATRIALLTRIDQPDAPLPAAVDAAYFPVTCPVCHDPHATTAASGDEAALRNPLFSIQPYSFDPSSDRSFTAQYNPSVQLCGQCHNIRGARWENTARAPHPSPQYSMLIGNGGYDLGNSIIAPHGEIDEQCIQCHIGGQQTTNAPPGAPDVIGHTFTVQLQGCVECHITSRAAEAAKNATQQQTKTQIQNVKSALDNWALNKAPADLRTKYGPRAWEYTIPGSLSNPTGDPTITGPSASEQALVPDAIKQARLNLYLVQVDGSFGVHNGPYARYLLSVAGTNMNVATSQP